MVKRLFSALDGAPPEKVTSADIRVGLKKYFPHPEFGIVFEVAQATGHSAHRHLDAVAMDTWPSRGLTLTGIEIKVDLHDWRAEKRNPEKAEQIARFCDVFYIAAPADLIPTGELPDAWGLLEYAGGEIKLKKGATKTAAVPVDRTFMAAIFRALGRTVDPSSVERLVADGMREAREDMQASIKDAAERLSKNNSDDAKNWRALLEAVGESGDAWDRFYSGDAERLIAVIKAIRQAGVMEQWNGLAALLETVRGFHDRLSEAVKILHVPTDHIIPAANKARRKRNG